jgi:hypothetical protein
LEGKFCINKGERLQKVKEKRLRRNRSARWLGGRRKWKGFGKTEAHGGWRGGEDGRFELCAFYLML